MRSLVFALAALGLCALLTTAPARALDEYRVVGVASNDSLNMREDVAGGDDILQAKIVGTIPADGTGVLATGVTIKLSSGLWREVRYGEVTGWVNGRYLKQVRRRFDGILPEDMDCHGT
ncbi:MAG: hypothetical protein ACR2PM_17810, partial [Hyphomicrobiales bacterium]